MKSPRILMISRPSLLDAPGGDTVQLLETAKALRKLNVEVDFKMADEKIDYSTYDLIHFFNVIRPNILSYHIKKSSLPFVISTIFVDYSEIEKKYRSLPFKLCYRILGADGMEYLKTLARALKNGEAIFDFTYLWKGHKKSVEALLNQAEMLLPNSESEFRRLKNRYRFNNRFTVIPNAVSDEFIDRSANLSKVDRKGVICVARIEMIKNQLNLIKALNQTDIPLKIIGKAAPNHQAYFQICKEVAGDNVEFLGQLSKAEVIKEMGSARVHVLPSFFETTGLSSLEAAACGCNIVISNRGDSHEYFEDYAHYCEPSEPRSIRTAIEKALDSVQSDELREKIRENYRWEIAAKKSKEAYLEVINEKK